MSLTVTLGPLWVFDEGDGLGRAEPYIWPVFYKVDEEALDWIADPERDVRPEPPWFIAPGGSHDNLPRADAGDRFEVVRTHTFSTFTPLAIIPNETAVGFAVVLLEEDAFPSDATINSAYLSFASAVRQKVIDTVNDRLRVLWGDIVPAARLLPVTILPGCCELNWNRESGESWRSSLAFHRCRFWYDLFLTVMMSSAPGRKLFGWRTFR